MSREVEGESMAVEPTDVQVRAIADRLAFYGSWHSRPFGTPESDTPWYQREGYPIFDAIRRHVRIAVRRAIA